MKNDKKGDNAIKTHKAVKPKNAGKDHPELTAIDQAPSSEEESHNDESTCQEIVSAILKSLFGPGVDSTNRLPTMLNWFLDYMYDPDVTWPVFHEAWSCCDVTGPYDEDIEFFFETALTIASMQSVKPVDFLHPDDKAAYDALPDKIVIHRGCSRSRAYRVSWTTDIKVAEGFAEGHRGIPVKDPVVASMQIPKSAIIGFYTAREENEVVIAPGEFKKRKPTIRDFRGA